MSSSCSIFCWMLLKSSIFEFVTESSLSMCVFSSIFRSSASLIILLMHETISSLVFVRCATTVFVLFVMSSFAVEKAFAFASKLIFIFMVSFIRVSFSWSSISVMSCPLWSVFRHLRHMGLLHTRSTQNRLSSFPCSWHFWNSWVLCCSCVDCLLIWVRRYLFCGKLFSFFTSCFARHSGHIIFLPWINWTIHVWHRVWLHGNSLGTWAPSSSNSSKQTWHWNSNSKLRRGSDFFRFLMSFRLKICWSFKSLSVILDSEQWCTSSYHRHLFSLGL